MALITSPGFSYKTADTQVYDQGGIWARGYQTKQEVLTQYAYWDNSTVYPLTAVGTGTFQTFNDTPPLQANQNTIFDPNNSATQVPLVAENHYYTRITAAANNDGANMPVNWSVTTDGTSGIAALVYRSNAGTAISAKIKLRSSGGNESVFALTTAADTNWHVVTWNPQVAGNGVTLTGSPVFSGITVAEVTLNALSTNLDVAMLYTANHPKLAIGSVFAISMREVDMASFKYNLESAVREAYQQQTGKTASGKKPEFEVECVIQNDWLQALVYGTMLKNGSITKPTLVNNELTGNRKVSSGQIASIPSSWKTPFVEVRFGNEFLQLWDGSSATIPSRGYYMVSGGNLIFATSSAGAYEGMVPTIVVDDTVAGDYFDNTGLQLGYYVRFEEKVRLLDGLGERNRLFYRVIMDSLEFTSDKANDKVKVKFSILPTGGVNKYFTQSRF